MTPAADLRSLPSVDEVLGTAVALAAVERFGRPSVVNAVRATLAEARARRQGLSDPKRVAGG
ncbi:MAG TPA: L-seryl-tRNA(Sec) selenium transferase, partial [Pseudorhodoplanes sp.]|nr:L-seryl-tRNA(Sec) selenium transferase [Pseudorhodoplanes sp.]